MKVVRTLLVSLLILLIFGSGMGMADEGDEAVPVTETGGDGGASSGSDSGSSGAS